MNFIFYSITNDFESFHRKREIEAIASDTSNGSREVIYFGPPQFLFLKLLKFIFKKDSNKKNKSNHSNIKILNLYALIPIKWALKLRILTYLFITLPIKLQTLYVKKYYLNSNNYISWFYKPDQYCYLKSLGPYIYLHYDNYKGDKSYNFSHSEYFDITLQRCIENSLFTLVCSAKLFNKYKTINTDKVLYYPNAVSRTLIATEPSSEIITKEINIGFIGQLDKTFDVELITKIACAFTNCRIKLIGPITNNAKIDILREYKNIDLLGYIDYEELSKEIRSFSIGICPYTKTNFNQYRNPLKIIEYFSYGLPVVSVECDIDKKALKLVGIASNDDEFISLIKQELEDNNYNKVNSRKKFARNNCWDNRAEFIINKVKDINL